jgi:hypothetical protein
MNGQCFKCGKGQEDPSRVAARYRVPVAECEVCGRRFCADCLEQDAQEQQLMGAAEIAQLQQADAHAPETYMFGCEESGMQMCPTCYEAAVVATT